MKFALETTITKPRAVVWKAFDNPDNMSKWQPGLKSFEHVSGEAGKPGAVSKLTYFENGREIVLTETVTRRNKMDDRGRVRLRIPYDANARTFDEGRLCQTYTRRHTEIQRIDGTRNRN